MKGGGTERKQAKANLAFLASVSQDLARLTSVEAIMQTVGAKLGAYLNLSLCAFAEINEAADHAVVTHDWHRGDARGVVGEYRLAEFLTGDFQKAGRAGEIFVVRDTATDPRTDAARYATLKIASFVYLPLIQDGQWRFLLSLHRSDPSDWREDEIELIRELTTRIWLRLESVRAETALRESEKRFRELANHAPVMVWVTEPNGACSFLSESWYRFTGQTPAEGLGFGWIDATHPDDRQRAHDTFVSANAQQGPFRIEYRLRRHDGIYRWAIDAATPRLGENGEFHGYVGSVLDIHDQKMAQEALRLSESRFRSAVGAVSSLIWTNDAEGKMEGEQPGWSGFTGQSYEEYRGYGWAKAVHPEDAQPTIDAWNQAVAEKRMFEFEHRVRRRDGEWRLCSIRAVPVFGDDGNVREWVGVHTDITERQRTEEALRESEERFRAIAGNIPQLAWMVTGEGYVEWFNEAWLAYTGTTLEANQGVGWKAVHHPDHIEHVAEKFERYVREGKDWEDTFPLRGQDGQYRWFLSRMKAIRDESGKVLRFFGTNTDVTELRETQARLADANKVISSRSEELETLVAERTADMRKMNEEMMVSLVRQDKLAADLRETIEELEGFSYSISHDMRAPLRAMQSFAQILEEECGDQIGPQGKEYVRRIVTSADRMDRLIRDVLTYSRIARSELPLENVDLAALLNGILEGYPQFQAPKAELVVVFPLPRVYANAAALTQCLSNLIGNGVKFVAPGIVPKVRIWAEVRDKRVHLFVRDNGIGIDPRMHGKIFGIFYRLGKDYDGTGIGLAVVKRAAQRMGGQIALESEPGKGSTFQLELESAVWK